MFAAQYENTPRAISTSGYMGTVKENLQVPEVVTAINSMQDNEYRVVWTQFGWHVVQRLPAPPWPRSSPRSATTSPSSPRPTPVRSGSPRSAPPPRSP
ncbi:MAG: peptidylprolyl isomerase [Geodermatophilaceae bacterium]|nr:peptidylprolyl isomerase [Geodermatophilaceae bacterium]